MNAIALVKHVPDTAQLSCALDGLKLMAEGPHIINPWDEYAVEECLKLREAHGGQATVLSLGPADAVSRHYRGPAPLAIDGRLYVAGIDYLHAVDAYNGRTVWERHLPNVGRWPAAYLGGSIAADGDAAYALDGPFCLRLDRDTGETVWKTPRENQTRSYCAPIIRQIDGRTQMILSGSLCVASYDPHDGSRHWILDGPTEQYVASLVYNGELLFMTAGFPERHIMGIRPDGRGNVTDTHVVWHTQKGCSYVPSPIASRDGKYFLVVSDEGIASCFEASTGKRHWMERIGPHYSASLVLAGGLVYFLADDGTMKLVRPGGELDVVVENPLGENCHASPVISQGQLFLRAEKHLYCVGNDQ